MEEIFKNRVEEKQTHDGKNKFIIKHNTEIYRTKIRQIRIICESFYEARFEVLLLARKL